MLVVSLTSRTLWTTALLQKQSGPLDHEEALTQTVKDGGKERVERRQCEKRQQRLTNCLHDSLDNKTPGNKSYVNKNIHAFHFACINLGLCQQSKKLSVGL